MRALTILIIVFLFSYSNSWSQEEKSDSFDDLSSGKWPVGGSQRDTSIYDDQSEMYVSDPVEDSLSSKKNQGEALTEKQCARFAKRSVKRMDKLTARIRKTNDAYLAKFKESENALMQRMCFVSEEKAEALIQDAWHSFNRFENISQREGNQAPKGYFAELDTLTQATSYLSSGAQSKGPSQMLSGLAVQETQSCKCSSMSDVKAANARLKKELKRTECIQQYIKERNSFLKRALGDQNELLPQMQSVEKASYYFNQQVKEYQNVFADRSRLETIVFNALSKSPAFGGFMDQFGQLAHTANKIPVNSAQGPTLKIADLMANAPDETKDLLATVTGQAKEKMEPVDEISDKSKELEEAKERLEEGSEVPSNADSLKTESKGEAIAAKKDLAWKPNPLLFIHFLQCTGSINL